MSNNDAIAKVLLQYKPKAMWKEVAGMVWYGMVWYFIKTFKLYNYLTLAIGQLEVISKVIEANGLENGFTVSDVAVLLDQCFKVCIDLGYQ